MLPVCHHCHLLRCLPECLDDGGVADDHDDARDQEGDNHLVEGEVYADNEDDEKDDRERVTNSPDTIICVIAVGDGDEMSAVSIMVGKHVLGYKNHI